MVIHLWDMGPKLPWLYTLGLALDSLLTDMELHTCGMGAGCRGWGQEQT